MLATSILVPLRWPIIRFSGWPSNCYSRSGLNKLLPFIDLDQSWIYGRLKTVKFQRFNTRLRDITDTKSRHLRSSESVNHFPDTINICYYISKVAVSAERLPDESITKNHRKNSHYSSSLFSLPLGKPCVSCQGWMHTIYGLGEVFICDQTLLLLLGNTILTNYGR